MKIHIPHFGVLFTCFSTLFLTTSCGDDDKDSSTPSSQALYETWEGPCESFTDEATTEKVRLQFSDAAYTANLIEYVGPGCDETKKNKTATVTGSVEVLGQKNENGYDILKVTYSTFSITLHSEEEVSLWNKVGTKTWEKDVAQNIDAAQGGSYYNIYEITGDTVCFGDDYEWDETNDLEDVPANISDEYCYTKQ